MPELKKNTKTKQNVGGLPSSPLTKTNKEFKSIYLGHKVLFGVQCGPRRHEYPFSVPTPSFDTSNQMVRWLYFSLDVHLNSTRSQFFNNMQTCQGLRFRVCITRK